MKTVAVTDQLGGGGEGGESSPLKNVLERTIASFESKHVRARMRRHWRYIATSTFDNSRNSKERVGDANKSHAIDNERKGE